MSPAALASAGMASVRKVSSPFGAAGGERVMAFANPVSCLQPNESPGIDDCKLSFFIHQYKPLRIRSHKFRETEGANIKL
jgi:hypothetical protein